MVWSSSQSKKELKADIESGVLQVYTVSAPTDPNKTQRITVLATSSTPVALLFNIFAENLSAKRGNFGEINILTNQFDTIEQISKNELAFINFVPKIFKNETEIERYLKDEHGDYKKTETAIGTLYEYEEKNSISGSGRFMWMMYFKDREDTLLVSVSYRSIDDQMIKRAPVISREYAKSLYDLITSTLELKFINPVPDNNAS